MKRLRFAVPFIAASSFVVACSGVADDATGPDQLSAAFDVAATAQLGRAPVCHTTGNGSYSLLNVNGNALPAHLAHGDGLPGASVEGGVLGDDCSVVPVVPTQIVRSATLNFSGGGWAGWSCPAGTQIVSATTELAVGGTGDGQLAELVLWRAGAVTSTAVSYPSTPFGYTYGAGEEGAIGMNNGDNDQIVIVLVCTV